MEINGTFQIEQQDDTVILIPLVDLGELEYERIQTDAQTVFQRLAKAHAKNVVVDFCKTDYYGSTALGFFVRLWKRAKTQGGHMAFSNVSPLEREILEVTKLDTLWSICGSRDEAVAAVKK